MKTLLAIACLIAAMPICASSATAQIRIMASDVGPQTINRIQMSNTPLSDAITLVADLGRVSIYVDRESIEEAGISMQSPVTATLRNSTVDEILTSILPAGLDVTKQDSCLVISTTDRIATRRSFDLDVQADVSDSTGLIDAGQLAVEQAFSQTMPMHFQHLPLEAAVQMLVGMAGKHAQFDHASRHHRFRMVTLHRDDSTLKENLDDLLDAADLTWEVSGQVVIIKEK